MSANPVFGKENVSRRDFLKTTAAASGGLLIAITLPGCGKKPAAVGGEASFIEPNAWLRIGSDDSITFYCDKSEMGQGVYTALTMLVAEELGVPLARINTAFAPPGGAYINTLIGGQITGGSTSVRDGWEKLRKAGATARTMLITAAANQWSVDPRNCRGEDGVIVSPHLEKLRYGEVADAASKLTPPKDVALKPASQFTLVGKPQKRKDTPSKVDGTCVYGIDVKLPGMLYAALAQSPVLGGSVKTFDGEKA